jgi:hypothetical protein
MCPLDAGDGGHKRALKCGRHRQGPGVARLRQRLNHSPLRPSEEQARGQPDISCEVLKTVLS